MSPSEVWQVDLGMAGKIRPCLLVTGYPDECELALVTIIPHTTALRGNRWEVAIPKPFLRHGAFDLLAAPEPPRMGRGVPEPAAVPFPPPPGGKG